MALHARLYDRAVDLLCSVTNDILPSESGVDSIVNVLHKIDGLSVLNDLFEDFSLLVNTKRGGTESFKNFEMRFSAQVSRYNAQGQSIILPEFITVLSLLVNSDVSDSQSIPIRSATAAKATSKQGNRVTNDVFLKLVQWKYCSFY